MTMMAGIVIPKAFYFSTGYIGN